MSWKDFRRRERIFLPRHIFFAAAKCHDYGTYTGKL